MSQFTDAVRVEICSVARDYKKPIKHNDVFPSLPMNLTEIAVHNVLTHIYDGIEYDAQMATAGYSAEILLKGDTMLTELGMINTPEGGIKRIEAIMQVVKLNKEMGGNDEINNGLIAIMSDYWNKIPLFFNELQTVFDVMSEKYNPLPKYKGWRYWTHHYHLRDGILGVAEKLLTNYGLPYDEKVHTQGFGMILLRQKLVLPDVSTREFMETLCDANIKLSKVSTRTHISEYDVKEDAEDWKQALTKAINSN